MVKSKHHNIIQIIVSVCNFKIIIFVGICRQTYLQNEKPGWREFRSSDWNLIILFWDLTHKKAKIMFTPAFFVKINAINPKLFKNSVKIIRLISYFRLYFIDIYYTGCSASWESSIWCISCLALQTSLCSHGFFFLFQSFKKFPTMTNLNLERYGKWRIIRGWCYLRVIHQSYVDSFKLESFLLFAQVETTNLHYKKYEHEEWI